MPAGAGFLNLSDKAHKAGLVAAFHKGKGVWCVGVTGPLCDYYMKTVALLHASA